ncbi:MAG: DUF3857 domain-containing protein, partial [Puniceicoccales bacterium]|nr:DUF3857 domain-containing protein [Puniceicoccales bacterium]
MSFSSRLAVLALALAAILPGNSIYAAESTTTQGAAIAPIRVDAAVLTAITPEKYPDADYVLVDNFIQTRYLADGTGTSRDDSVTKILTEKGRRQNRTQSLNYNVFYEGQKIILARIIKPDGTLIDIDIEKNSKEMTDRSSMDANIYDPNDKLVTLAIPDLQIGDALQVVVEKTTKRARMVNTFCDWQSLESTNPILNIRYEIRGPLEKPLRSFAVLDKVGDTVTHSVREEGKERVYTWIAKDVPQAFPEPGMPAFYTCAQRLLVSTAGSWEEVSKWYWDISEPHLATTPEITAKVKELINGASDDSDKINRIFKFVSQEVRYMGITVEKEAPGYEPHDVKLTFDNRYGVCRDKAALLVTMLREAGLDAYPVLMRVGPLMDGEVPQPYFNHAITAVRNPDGTYQLMDTTDENTADLLPSYLFNKSYLVANPKGETLHASPVAPPEDNMVFAKTKLDVAKDGGVTGTVSIKFTGINDNAFRGSFAKAKPEDIRRFFETIIKRSISGATLNTFEITPKNMMDTSQKMQVKLEFSAPDFFVISQDKTVLPMPWTGSNVSIASMILGNGCGLEKRRFPLEIDYTAGLSEQLIINLPDNIGKTLALPSPCSVDTPAVTFAQIFTRDDLALVGSLEMRLRAPQVRPEDYAQLKNALKEIEYAGRQSPVLAAREQTKPQADVRILENKTDIVLQDANNWTTRQYVRKEILTYAGKKSSGELHLDYNPIWEDVKLENVKVTLKDGSVRTLQPEEMNLMDASWVAAAPRYPAGKTLVVSLPGVEEGATVQYEIVRVNKNKVSFQVEKSFFGFDPVDKDTFTLSIPENVRLYVSNGFDGTDKDNTGPRVYKFEQSRELTKREGNLPPYAYLGPTFQASTFDNLETYAKIINDAVSPLCKATDAVKAKANELTANCSTDTEKVTAIRDYVAKYVRNAGPNFTSLPLNCLTPAGTTLTDGYGNEADRSILLVSLLEAAGFQPHLFLSATSPSSEIFWSAKNLFPTNLFPRLIVEVLADNTSYYLDNLSIYSELGTTGLDGCMAIRIDSPHLRKISTSQKFMDCDSVHYTMTIDANGDAEIKVERTFPGISFEGFKRGFTEITPEERNRYHQQCITSVAQSAVPASELVTDLAYPGKLSYSAKVSRYAVRSGNYLYFDLPGATTSATPAGADTRALPLFASSKVDSQISWNITLPAGVVVQAAPEEISWIGPGDYGAVNVSRKTLPGQDNRQVLEVNENMAFEPFIIPAG